jgi:peptidoglycan hydrolase CwlO-like protein
VSLYEWYVAGVFVAVGGIESDIMGLDTKTVAELQEIAANLREQIRRNANHLSFYKGELKDAEQLIRERQRKFPPMPADISF